MDILLTDLTSVSPYFRLLNKIRARRQSIHWQARVQKSHPKKMKTDLKALRAMENELNSVDMYSISSSSYKKISRAFNAHGTRENHMTGIFGKCLMPSKNREICQVETNMLRTMAMDNKLKRIKELQTRILLEIIDKESKGWLIVFNTLTVANEHYKEVFDKDSRVFEKYILSIIYSIKKQYGKSDTSDTGSYHSYFAVVEEGGKTGRLHFHVLHCCRCLPAGSSDPNSGRKLPERRIITAMRKFWTKGFSSPIAVRLGGQDNYARLGWRWPVKRNENNDMEAINTSNPLRMARYMAKYITKANEEGAFRWRTRISRGYGTTIIKKSISKISTEILKNNLINVTMWKHLEVMDISIPLALSRKLAIREYLLRKKSSSNGSTISTTQKSLMKVHPRSSIVEQLRTLTQKRQKSNSQNTTCFETKNLKRKDIFEIRKAFNKELTKCGYHKVVQESRGVTWPSQ